MTAVTLSRDSKGAAARHPLAVLLDTRLSGLCLVAVVLGLWEASARFGIVESLNWPPFSAVVVALCRNLATGELVLVIGSTLSVMLRGYVIGCALGIAIGFAIALSRPLRLAVEPTIDILRTIPTTAIDRIRSFIRPSPGRGRTRAGGPRA